MDPQALVLKLNQANEDLDKNLKIQGEVLYQLYHYFKDLPKPRARDKNKGKQFAVTIDGQTKEITCNTFQSLFLGKIVYKISSSAALNAVKRWVMAQLIFRFGDSTIASHWLVNDPVFFEHFHKCLNKFEPGVSLLSAKLPELERQFNAELQLKLRWILDMLPKVSHKRQENVIVFDPLMIAARDFDILYNHITKNTDYINLNINVNLTQKDRTKRMAIEVITLSDEETPLIPAVIPLQVPMPAPLAVPSPVPHNGGRGGKKRPRKDEDEIIEEVPEDEEMDEAEVVSENNANDDIEIIEQSDSGIQYLNYKNFKNLDGFQYWLFPFDHKKSKLGVANFVINNPVTVTLDQMLNVFGWNVLIVTVPPGYNLIVPAGWYYAICLPHMEPTLKQFIRKQTKLVPRDTLCTTVSFNVLSTKSLIRIIDHALYEINLSNKNVNVLGLFVQYLENIISSEQKSKYPMLTYILDNIIKFEARALKLIQVYTNGDSNNGKIDGRICNYCGFVPYKKWFSLTDASGANKVVCIFCAAGLKGYNSFKWDTTKNHRYYDDKRLPELANFSATFRGVRPEVSEHINGPVFGSEKLLLHNTPIIGNSEFELLEPVLFKNTEDLSDVVQGLNLKMRTNFGTSIEQVARNNVKIGNIDEIALNQCAVGKVTNRQDVSVVASEFTPLSENDVFSYTNTDADITVHHGYVVQGLSRAPFCANVVNINL